MEKRNVKIQVHEVGQAFGVTATVRDVRSRKRLHKTRVFPHGFDAAARDNAQQWCDLRGYRIDQPNE